MSNNSQAALDEQNIETIESVVITDSPEEMEKISQAVQLYTQTQLHRFDVTASDKAIAELKDKYLKIQVSSLEDRAIAKEANRARMEVRRIRLVVTKLQEQILESPKEMIEQIKKRGGEIIEELKTLEDHLKNQEDLFKDLKDLEQERKDQEERDKINMRNDILIGLHMAFNGRGYSLEHLSIDNNQVADFSDQEFNDFVDTVKPVSEGFLRKKEIEKVFGERKVTLRQMGFADNSEGIWSFYEVVVDAETVQTCDDEAFEAILARAKVVADRVKQEMEDFKAHQAKIKEDQEKLKQSITSHRVSVLKSAGLTIKENTAEDKWQIFTLNHLMELGNDEFDGFITHYKDELEKKQRGELRSAALKSLDFYFHTIDKTYRLASSKSTLNINESALQENTEEDWAIVLEKANQVASEVKEDMALAERTDKRIQDLTSRGFKKEEGFYEMKYFVFGDYTESEFLPENCLTITRTQLDIYTDEQWNDLILEATAFLKSKTENELLWQQFQDKEKEKAAEIRRTALLPDKKKLIEFSAKVAALWKEMPEMDTAEGKVIRERQLAALNGLAHTIKAEAEAMS